MIVISLIILGLVFGSFINALVWRTHEKKSVMHGRSMCPHCRHELSAKDLVPLLSWLALGGRCRYCRQPISYQYPLVEAATASLFAVSYLYWPRDIGDSYEVAYFGLWLVSLVLMIAMAVYDLKWMLLPDKFNWPFVLSALLSVAVLGQIDTTLLGRQVGGGVAAWTFFAALYYGSKGRWLGGGDVKYALGMGLWLGLGKVLVGVLAAFYAACLVVLPLLLMRIIQRRQPVPFGPFLIAGTIIAMIFGQDLIDWYKNTFLIVA